jgi:hypothetical protein
MTEAEWLAATDPEPMLKSLHETALPSGVMTCDCCQSLCRQRPAEYCPLYRKLRLLALECCRRILHLLADPTCLQAVQALELHLEGISASYDRAVQEFDAKRRAGFPGTPYVWNALYCAVHRHWQSHFDNELVHADATRWKLVRVVVQASCASAGDGERIAQCHLIRDLFGNPFRPTRAIHPGCITRSGAMIVKFAAEIYNGRSFDRLPILADALEDAGCTDAELLGHLRGPGPHVRGCWALDRVLGRE